MLCTCRRAGMGPRRTRWGELDRSAGGRRWHGGRGGTWEGGARLIENVAGSQQVKSASGSWGGGRGQSCAPNGVLWVCLPLGSARASRSPVFQPLCGAGSSIMLCVGLDAPGGASSCAAPCCVGAWTPLVVGYLEGGHASSYSCMHVNHSRTTRGMLEMQGAC